VVAGERNSQAEVQGVELRREEEKKNHEGTKPCFLFPNKAQFERGQFLSITNSDVCVSYLSLSSTALPH
jgi:hypothetical protein